MAEIHLDKAILATELSDLPVQETGLTLERAQQIFDYFKNCSVFRWADVNNNCEDRAEAICMLLESWGFPNYKGWVFGGCMFKEGGGNLTNNWKYHVAAIVPVREQGELVYYIIDPATSPQLQTLHDWANAVTEQPLTKYVVKESRYYIFMPGFIEKFSWFERNSQNYKWTIQGLSGINGLSSVGKAYLAFNKRKVAKTEKAFKELLGVNPVGLRAA